MNKNDFDAFCPKFPTFSNKQQHYDCDALRKVSHSVTQPSALLLSASIYVKQCFLMRRLIGLSSLLCPK